MTQKEYKEKTIDKFVLKIYETNQYLQGKHLLYQIKPKNTKSEIKETEMFDYIKAQIIANAGTLHVDDDNISTQYNYSSEGDRDAYLDSTSWEFLNILSQTSDIIGCNYLKIFKTDIDDNLAGDEIIKARTLITGGLGLYYYIMKRNNQISVTTGEIKLA